MMDFADFAALLRARRGRTLRALVGLREPSRRRMAQLGGESVLPLASGLAEPVDLLLRAELLTALSQSSGQIFAQSRRRYAELLRDRFGPAALDVDGDHGFTRGRGQALQRATDALQLLALAEDLALGPHRLDRLHPRDERDIHALAGAPTLARVARRRPDPLLHRLRLGVALELGEQLDERVVDDLVDVGAPAKEATDEPTQGVREALGHRRVTPTQQLDVEGGVRHSPQDSAAEDRRLAERPRAISGNCDSPDENGVFAGLLRFSEDPTSVHFPARTAGTGAGPGAGATS